MAGKGPQPRPYNVKRSGDNYDKINWSRKAAECDSCQRFVYHDEGKIRCCKCGKIRDGQIFVTSRGVKIWQT